MGWTGTKTDWSEADRMSCEELNRIFGNVNYLYPSADLKSDYTQNDFLTSPEWQAFLDALEILKKIELISTLTPSSVIDFNTINQAEELIQELYDKQNLMFKQNVANRYAGDGWYLDESYAGGI